MSRKTKPGTRAPAPPPPPSPPEAATPGWIAEAAGAVRLSLKVQPRASRNGLQGVEHNELKIRVTAPPVDSAANTAVLELIAAILGLAKSQVALVRGASSRHKVVHVQGLPLATVQTRLEAAIDQD